MRQIPVDEEFGPLIATLGDSPIAWFENRTIAKLFESDESTNQLLFKNYRFYYEGVSQITIHSEHLLLN